MATRARSLALLAAAAVALALVPAAAATAARPAAPDLLRADLDALAADPDAVSAIAEVRGDGAVWRGASGPATLTGSRPASPAGSFRAGSVTKSFVAVVVLQLVAEGRLRLTETVSGRLPGLLPTGDRVTVEDLLRHTSGLPDYTEGLVTDPESLLALRHRTWLPRELVELAVRGRPLPPPGTFAYSNTDYVVLGMLVEQVTGRSYRDAVTARVLRPLGLRRTYLPGAQVRLRGPHAHGYVQVSRTGRTADVDVTRLNMTVAGAAGELVSTTADLNRFQAALLGGRLLPPDLLRAMTTARDGSGHGMGLEVAELSCGPVIGHGGGVPGFLTVSFGTADGSRQATVSVTSRRAIGWTPGLLRRAVVLLDHALCPPARPASWDGFPRTGGAG